MVGDTNEITLRLNVSIASEAPLALELGPVFLDWMYLGNRMGPVSIPDVSIQKGWNDVIIYAGFYPSMSNVVGAMKLFAELMNTETPPLICVSGRSELSSEERDKVYLGQFPLTQILYEGSLFLKEACANLPDLSGPISDQLKPVVIQLLKAVGGAAAPKAKPTPSTVFRTSPPIFPTVSPAFLTGFPEPRGRVDLLDAQPTSHNAPQTPSVSPLTYPETPFTSLEGPLTSSDATFTPSETLLPFSYVAVTPGEIPVIPLNVAQVPVDEAVTLADVALTSLDLALTPAEMLKALEEYRVLRYPN